MWNGSDERLWRPLHSPRLLQISAFSDTGPRGFGLIQRERRLHRVRGPRRRSTTAGRASGSSRSATGARATWCWWRSRANEEVHDNIVAYWRPRRRHRRGQRDRADLPAELGLGRAGPGGLLRVERHADRRRRRTGGGASWSTSPARRRRPIRASAVQLMAQANPGRSHDAEISENPEINGLRLQLRPRPGRRRPRRDAHRAAIGRAAGSPKPGSTDGAADPRPAADRAGPQPAAAARRRSTMPVQALRRYDRERRCGSRASARVRLARAGAGARHAAADGRC